MIEHESTAYRRGLTLGLTMAEIFILILFLLLLVLLALYDVTLRKEEKLTEVTTKYEEMKSSLPEQIKHLILKNSGLKEKLSDSEKGRDQATAKLEAVKRVSEKNTKLSSKKWKKLYEKQTEELIKKERELKKVQEKIKQLEQELYASKGIHPPCWYQVKTKQQKRHEKTEFLMDVAVHDDYLHVQVLDAPSGRAIDENGRSAPTSYAEEHKKLPLAPFSKSRKLSLEEFTKMTSPIKNMGESKRIRDYSCVFHVKVWDLTSTTAKERWKKAEDAIKVSFYPLRVRNDQWQHGDVAD